MAGNRFFDPRAYFSNIYPHYTYQNLLKTAKFKADKVFEGSPYYSSADDCFLYLHHMDGGLTTDLYSHFKVHVNLAENSELIDAWNNIAFILTATEANPIKQIKVVVPEWVNDEKKGIAKIDRDRRLTGAQITLYIYFKSKEDKEIDIDAYVLILEAIERALSSGRFIPPTIVPDNDLPISQYLSMREDLQNDKGEFLSFVPGKKGTIHPLIEEFKKRLDAKLNNSISNTSTQSSPEFKRTR